MRRDFDSPWKETLQLFFERIMQLFYPDIHAAIDWSKGYKSLDKELHAIIAEAELGSTLADKLFHVHLRDGTEGWILIHVEVQSQYDRQFPRRMFGFHCRILERYNQDVVNLAILGDSRKNWRPTEYKQGRFGCEVRFRFRAVKLLDWKDRTDELAANPNPIALIVLAHLQSLTTHKKPDERLRSKWQLIRGLYDRGLDAKGVRELYRLIDWLLELPPELQQLRNDLYAFEEERRMPYISSTERMAREEGIEKGTKKGLIQGLSLFLEMSFGKEGLVFIKDLRKVNSLAKLTAIEKAIRARKSLDELRKML